MQTVVWLKQLVEQYPELSWLTGEVQSTPEMSQDVDGTKTLGEQIFPTLEKASLTEFNRTAVGLACLNWVLEGDYSSFTACQKDGKMTEESFQELREYTQKVLQDRSAQEAMVVYTIINDLGKIEAVIQKAKALGVEDIDHDKVLVRVLETSSKISPSFNNLPQKYKQLILEGLNAEFNLGQYAQAENVPGSLSKLSGLSQEALDFCLIHTLFDVAGAAGQFVQNGSVVLSEATYQSFKLAMETLRNVQAEGVVNTYNAYLLRKAATLGIDSLYHNKMITRLCCMLRISSHEQAQIVSDVVEELKDSPQRNIIHILDKEIGETGVDGWATLTYYAPAILANLLKGKADQEYKDALKAGLSTLAIIYQESRMITRKRDGNGVFTVMGSDVAATAPEGVEALKSKAFSLEMKGEDAHVSVSDKTEIDPGNLRKIDSPSQIPGQRVAFIAMGGGSDCIQASILAQVLQKDVAAVISVRGQITKSQGATGRINVKREVYNPKAVLSDNIYEIGMDTTGNGRFLENLPADHLPIFLVLEEQENLAGQLQTVLDHVKDVDTVIGVDTGGDGLYPISINEDDQVKATPDQDLRIIMALQNLKVPNILTCEIAVGVDSPDNAQEVLEKASAEYYELPQQHHELIFERYKAFGIDGTSDSKYGKTPFAWQAALKGGQGNTWIPLPPRVVLSESNPWRSYVYLQPVSKGMFFMDAKKHLDAISSL